MQSEPRSHSAGERLGKLHDVATLVARLAGARTRVAVDVSWIDSAYDEASTLSRARFDDLAARASAVASAGVQALLACGEGSPTALATLAEAIEAEIGALERMLGT